MTPIPNTFQCPNTLIDRAMELLSDKEFRVLMFAVRHIMGWQDRIDDRQGYISISMFEHGFTSRSGKRFAGCGLGRGAIISAVSSLVEFGFMEKQGKATAKGQIYTLLTSGIKWDELEKRAAQQDKANRQRTITATQARRAGTSDVPVTSDDTMQGTSDDTMQGTSDVLNQTHSSNPSSNPSSADKPRTPRKEKKKTIPAAQMNPMKDALAVAFNRSWETMTKAETGPMQVTAKELCQAGISPAEVPSLYAYCKKNFTTFGPRALSAHVSDWRETVKKAVRPAPIVEQAEVVPMLIQRKRQLEAAEQAAS